MRPFFDGHFRDCSSLAKGSSLLSVAVMKTPTKIAGLDEIERAAETPREGLKGRKNGGIALTGCRFEGEDKKEHHNLPLDKG